MTYSKSPVVSTYSTERVPLGTVSKLRAGNAAMTSGGVFNPTYTGITQDAGMINLLPMKDEKTGELYAITRPFIAGITTVSGTGRARGMYVWEKTPTQVYYFFVVGTQVWTLDAIAGGSMAVVTTLLTNVTTPVRFCEFIDATNVKKLVLVDGIEGYVFTSNAAGTKIVDVDFPTPHVPFPVFIDGYLFLAKANTGDIYNSDLNDPAVWTAGSFISSELYPDNVQALVKIDNYLLAIGTQGSEYFYDAGNATASPLARYEGASLPFGTSFPNSIASTKDSVTMLADDSAGQPHFKTIKDFKSQDMESNPVVPLLQHLIAVSLATYDGVRGYYFRNGSKIYYGFTTSGVAATNADQTRTKTLSLVYCFETKGWVEFAFATSSTASDGNGVFPAYFTCEGYTGNPYTYCCGETRFIGSGTSSSYFFGYLRETGNSSTDVIWDTVAGAQTALHQEIRTEPLDFGTLNNKAMHRLAIYGNSGTSGTINYSVLWNDRDYSSAGWNTAQTLSSTATDWFPFITQLGMFRRRAFRLYTQSSGKIAIRYLEVDINKGQT